MCFLWGTNWVFISLKVAFFKLIFCTLCKWYWCSNCSWRNPRNTRVRGRLLGRKVRAYVSLRWGFLSAYIFAAAVAEPWVSSSNKCISAYSRNSYLPLWSTCKKQPRCWMINTWVNVQFTGIESLLLRDRISIQLLITVIMTILCFIWELGRW
jgi:hypothetical protein